LLYLQSDSITDTDAKEAIVQGPHRIESMALEQKKPISKRQPDQYRNERLYC